MDKVTVKIKNLNKAHINGKVFDALYNINSGIALEFSEKVKRTESINECLITIKEYAVLIYKNKEFDCVLENN